MVDFGVPAGPAKEGQPPPPPPALGTYIGLLEGLAGEMGTIEDGPPSASTQKATQKFEEAVAQISSWLEFPVRFDPRVDRAERVTLAAESLRGEDALLLLLLPRGLGPRIAGRSVEIAPLGPKPLPDK